MDAMQVIMSELGKGGCFTGRAKSGSPVSQSIGIAKMDNFNESALATVPNSPQVWYRYVDDTFTVLHMNLIEEFTNHINSLDPNIKFMIEEEQDGWLPFLDTCVIVNDNGTLSTMIYHKPTQTDQYFTGTQTTTSNL